MVLLFLSILYLILIIVGKPYIRPLNNQLSILNECMIGAYLYLMMTLTDFNSVNPIKD